MKRILFLRHSKTEHSYGFMSDFERNLTEIGRNDADQMASKLVEKNLYPGKIITSPANRAMQTAAIFAGKLNYPVDQIKVEEFFFKDFSARQFCRYMYHQENLLEAVMIIGHNPWISDIAARYCHQHYEHIPTSGIKSILFDVESWKDLVLGKGKLEFFDYPRHHKHA